MEAVITIVGFLGAGKTTVLKALVRSYLEKNWQPFIILNDYENASIDAVQFTNQIDKKWIKPLTGSCICCSGINELRNYVNGIPERLNGVTLIEANGTSDACLLMEFLGVGLKARFLPPVQISVVDVKNWQNRGEHNLLELSQIQVSSLIILTRIDLVSQNRKTNVVNELKSINPYVEITTLEELDVSRIPTLFPSGNVAQKIDHHRAHWASCSVDLPILPNQKSIISICNAIPKSILRVKGCTILGANTYYTFFERTPDGEVTIRPFRGVPSTGAKLLTIGPGSNPTMLLGIIDNLY